MSPFVTSVIIFSLIFGLSLVAILIQPYLSEHHLDEDTKSLVRLSMGVIGTIAALVLSLLISAGKSSNDVKESQLKIITAKIIFLDGLLAQYGSDALTARTQLRKDVDPIIERLWRRQGADIKNVTAYDSTLTSPPFIYEIERLLPRDDFGHSLKTRAIRTADEVMQMRLLLLAEPDKSIPVPFLIILVFWLSVIFASFTLFAKVNVVVVSVLFIGALSVAGSVFLILEMDDPFLGLMSIPHSLLTDALAPLDSRPGG